MKRLTKRNPYWENEEYWISAEELSEEEVYNKLKQYEEMKKMRRLYGFHLCLVLPCIILHCLKMERYEMGESLRSE